MPIFFKTLDLYLCTRIYQPTARPNYSILQNYAIKDPTILKVPRLLARVKKPIAYISRSYFLELQWSTASIPMIQSKDISNRRPEQYEQDQGHSKYAEEVIQNRLSNTITHTWLAQVKFMSPHPTSICPKSISHRN